MNCVWLYVSHRILGGKKEITCGKPEKRRQKTWRIRIKKDSQTEFESEKRKEGTNMGQNHKRRGGCLGF